MLHEPTTAITDFILGIETLVFALILITAGGSFPSQPYWIAAFILLGTAGILGGFAHGWAYRPLFYLIYVNLAMLMVLLLLAALMDGFGPEAAVRWRWLVIGVAVLFVVIAWRFPRHMHIYAAFEGLLMAGILAAYVWLALTHATSGAGFIAAGIGITLIAAGLFLRKVGFTLIWTFNHNDVYHLVQMVGVAFLFLGLFIRSSGT